MLTQLHRSATNFLGIVFPDAACFRASFRVNVGQPIHTAAVVIPLISIPHIAVNPGWGYVIRSAEILFAMLFLVVVIQRAVASFRK